jgi:hypothetical protein
MMEAVRTSETSVYFNGTTQSYIRESYLSQGNINAQLNFCHVQRSGNET